MRLSFANGLGLTSQSGGGGAVFQSDLIIVAYGQSNEQSSTLSGETILSSDQDESGVIGVWVVNQADPGTLDTTDPLQPMTWPANNANLGPARAFKMAQDMKPLMAEGKKIVIIPGAVGGQALVSGTLSAPSGTYYVDTTEALTQALAAYPGASVIMSITQGEQDGNNSRTQSQYETAFSAMAAGFRAIAPGMPIIIHQMQPDRFIDDPTDQPGRIPIDAAHKNLPLILDDCYFIPAEEGQGIVGDPSHFTAAAQRTAGARAAEYYNLPERYTAQPPVAPSAPTQVGSTSAINITVTNPPAPAYVIETRAQGSSDAWDEQVVHCPVWVEPGSTFTATATATGDVEVRLKTRSRFGDSAASSAVDMTFPWWDSAAFAQIDYTNDRAYIDGTSYASIAAARSASAIVVNGDGNDTVALTPSGSYSMAAKGTTPSGTGTGYILSADDGNADVLGNLVIFSTATSNTQMQMGAFVTSAQGDISAAVGASTAFTMAARLSANNYACSFDSATVLTDVFGTLPAVTRFVVGDRFDGLRNWGDGVIEEVRIYDSGLSDEALEDMFA